MMSIKGINLPEYIKQDGYIAEWNGEYYAMEYMKGGHLPEIGFILLTLEEMKVIYLDNTQYSKVMVAAERKQSERN